MPVSILRYLVFHRDLLALLLAVPLALFFALFVGAAGYAILPAIVISSFIFSFIVSFVAEKRTLLVCLVSNLIFVSFLLIRVYITNYETVSAEFFISETLGLWSIWFGIPMFFALLWGLGLGLARSGGLKE